MTVAGEKTSGVAAEAKSTFRNIDELTGKKFVP